MPIITTEEGWDAYYEFKASMRNVADAFRFICVDCGENGISIEPLTGPTRKVTCKNEHSWMEFGVVEYSCGCPVCGILSTAIHDRRVRHKDGWFEIRSCWGGHVFKNKTGKDRRAKEYDLKYPERHPDGGPGWGLIEASND